MIMERNRMIMKRFLILISLCLLSFTITDAQKQKYKSIVIQGEVVEELNGNYLLGTEVSLLRPDSTVVLSWITRNGFKDEGFFSFRVETGGDYILRFRKKGYDELCKNYYLELKTANEQKDLGTFSLVRTSHKLQNVTVRATKIKMVMEKDTIVYNADAFQLSEGSMLDALIRQLPGAELKDGQIKVNGRFISSLLVNGKDFFKGNPKVALENLPAYMVNKVKVYEREDEVKKVLNLKSQLNEKELVMDVNLKKQYNTGWTANAEAAAGTNGRYLSRLFGLRFTDRTRLSMFAKMNNTNDTRLPGNDGEWTPQGALGGRTSVKTSGLQWEWNNKKKTWNFTGKLMAEHQNMDSETKTSTENYLEEGNHYDRSTSINNNKTSMMEFSGDLKYTPKNFYLEFIPYINLNQNKENTDQRSATFSKEPWEKYRGAAIDSLFKMKDYLRNEIVNQCSNEEYERIRNFTTGGSLNITTKIHEYAVYLSEMGSYIKQSNFNYSQYDLNYGLEGKNDYRYLYRENPYKNYTYSSVLGVYKTFGDFFMVLCDNYGQTFTTLDNNRYRLERLKGWGFGTPYGLGSLPASPDSMLSCKDWFNSTSGHVIHKTQTPTYRISYQKLKSNEKFPGTVDWSRIELELPTSFIEDNLSYHKNLSDTSTQRKIAFFEPKLTIQFHQNADAIGYVFSYKLEHELADVVDRVNVYFNYDPLNLSYGNGNLRNRLNHIFEFKGNRYDNKTQTGMSYDVTYKLTENGEVNALVYDPKTGISSTRPTNVNGKWNLSGNYYYVGYFDRQKRWQYTTYTIGNYENNVDLIQDGLDTQMKRNSLHSLSLYEDVNATYRYGKNTIGTRVTWNWLYATSDRLGFSTIHTTDLTYNLNGTISLPWNLQLGTDLSYYTRYGYGDAKMNDNAWVWNARLSKVFMKDKLTLMLDGFDILNDVKNVQHSLSAMGHSETWYNSVNRYIMLHVIYRLNIQPKKKSED